MTGTPGFTTLSVEVDGRIGRLTLDQPDKLNPLGATTLSEIARAAAWFDETGASVVVVTGEGRAFSSGFDLREFAGSDSDERVDSRAQADLGRLMAEAMDRMTALTIAAIKGRASAAVSCSRRSATSASPPTTRCSRSPRSTSAFRWRGAAFPGWSVRSARR